MRLPSINFNFASLPYLLKLSCFLVVFALSSSAISVWFDYKRQDIDFKLSKSKHEQELFRDVYGNLWQSYFKLRSFMHDVQDYENSIAGNTAFGQKRQWVCMFENLKASHGDRVILGTLVEHGHFLTAIQKEKYQTEDLKQVTNTRVQNGDDGFYKYCATTTNHEPGHELSSVTARVEKVLKMARELKEILENRILVETKLLEENYKNSNLAIFIAFILQLFVFVVISVVDINTSVFKRKN